MLSAELSKRKYLKLAEVCRAPSTALHATPKKQTNKQKRKMNIAVVTYNYKSHKASVTVLSKTL